MISVALVGPGLSGKTSLLSALSHILPGVTPLCRPPRDEFQLRTIDDPEFPAAPDAVPRLDHIFIERNYYRTIAPKQPHVMEIQGRPFAFFDCPGELRWSRNAARCLALCDVAVLVSDVLGSEAELLQHAAMVNAMGVEELLVYVNRCDRLIDEASDPEAIEIQRDLFLPMIEESLSSQFPSARYFLGSTLWAMEDVLSGHHRELGYESIASLLDAVGSLSEPERKPDGPVRFWVQQHFHVAGEGAVVAGRLTEGTLRPGDLLEFRPPGRDEEKVFSRAEVVSIQRHKEPLEEAKAGDIIGVMLRQAPRWRVASGQLCTTPEQRRASDMATRIRGRLQMLPRRKPRRFDPRHHPTPIKGARSGYTPQFQAGTVVRDGTIVLPDGMDILKVGETAEVEVHFSVSIPLPDHRKLLIRDSSQIVGVLSDAVVVEDSDPWLWYQAETNESLAHLRGLLYGRPSEVLWARLLRFYQCGDVVDYEAERAVEHRLRCSEYALQHMEGWRRDLLARWDDDTDGLGALDGDWDGLWRCTSEEGDGAAGLGLFMEFQRWRMPGTRGRYRLRDAFVRIPNDLTDLLHSVMFVRIWIRAKPFVTGWALPKMRRLDDAQALGWMTTSWPDNIQRVFYHEVTATGPHTLERISFVYRGPFGDQWRGADRSIAARQTFERIARLRPAEEDEIEDS